MSTLSDGCSSGKIYGYASAGCISPGKIVMVDDSPNTVYWSTPQNPDSWSDSTGSHYSHITCDDLTQEFTDYLGGMKPRGRFETIQEELNKLHDQRIDRFEELLDQFDTLHAEFGE